MQQPSWSVVGFDAEVASSSFKITITGNRARLSERKKDGACRDKRVNG